MQFVRDLATKWGHFLKLKIPSILFAGYLRLAPMDVWLVVVNICRYRMLQGSRWTSARDSDRRNRHDGFMSYFEILIAGFKRVLFSNKKKR